MRLLLLVLGLFLGTSAFAANGLVFEVSGGFGYMYQSDSVQVKVLGSYYKGTYHDIDDVTTLKVSVAKDFSTVQDFKFYGGLEHWNNFYSSSLNSYYDRTGFIMGVRHELTPQLQVDIFTAVATYANSYAYHANTDTWNTYAPNSGWGLFRYGSISIAYLF